MNSKPGNSSQIIGKSQCDICYIETFLIQRMGYVMACDMFVFRILGKKACPYKEKCYRRNPIHFAEMSHPLRKHTFEVINKRNTQWKLKEVLC